MAATRKEYELLFQLKAALGSNFASTFKTAMQTTKQLQSTLADVKKVQSDISAFEKQRKAIELNKSRLEDLQAEHDKLQREIKETEQPSEALTQKLKKNEQQIASTTEKIKSQQKELDNLADKLKSTGVNTDNLTGANEKLEKAYKRLADSQEKLAKINAAYEKNAAAIGATRTQLLKTVGVVTALGAATYSGAIKPAIEFESAMAGVFKTVSGTPRQLLEIQNGIRKMATEIPISVVELAALAESAGQLGIKTESILGFTRTMADLGVTTNLAGEEAASTLAKFANITGMSQNNFDRLGSTIVALGNNLATTESDIAAMGLRLAGAGRQIGLTEAQILSFAGALSSVGIEAEAGGSAFSKVMNNMQLAVETGNKNLASFAKVAGMSAKEFQNAFKKDAAGAINAFIKGLGRAQENGESAIKVLDDMGITEVRMRDALLRAAGASDVFTQSIELGTKAWEENTALAEEASKRYETTESQIKIMKQAINDIGISLGSVFLPHLAKAAKQVSELAQRFSEFAQKNPELIKTITKVVGGLLAFKIGALGLKLAFLDIKGAGLAVQKVFALFGAGTAKASAQAITHTGTLSKLATGLKNYFGGVKGAAGGVSKAFSGAFGGTKAAGVFKGIAGGLSKVFGGFGGALTSVFTSFGGKVTKIFATIGSAITKGPLGKVVSVLAGGFGKLAKVLGPVGKLIMTALGPLAGIAGSVLPIVGVIAAIVAGIQILFGNLDSVHNFIEEKFGPEAAAVFDKIMNVVKNVGETIKNIFSDESLGSARNFLVNIFGEKSAGVIDGVFTMIKTVRDIIGEFITFCNNYVRPIIETLFRFIVEEVLPLIAAKFAEWAPIISGIIQNLWTVISNVAAAILSVIQFVLPTITDIIKVAVQTISGIIGGVLKVLQGVLDFIIGVFTGNWTKAWEGIKSIFAGVWEALKSIVKAPLNFIITAINTLIRGLNKLKIPDWVPLVGGKGINIPEIPMLAKGSKNTPSTFIAGEKGPELITNAPGRTVYTAKQTQAFLDIIRRIKDFDFPMPRSGAGGLAFAGGYATPATVTAGVSYGGTKITIHNKPLIQVDGAAPDDLEEKLQRNNENLLQMLDEWIRKKEDDERRQRYG